MEKVKNDPRLDDNLDRDMNSINVLMNIRYLLLTLKMVLMLFNISYFTGIVWMIYCDITSLHFVADTKEGHFIEEFDINSESQQMQMLMAMYYAFTSLSTVGFGDFYPISNAERILCTIILLFGVAIFSYIMGIFIDMLDNFKKVNADLDEGDELSRFFGLLSKFNNGKMFNEQFKLKVEEFFDHKWNFDKN
tara:strand:+ start:757 stop:1332 length:576 start_codon:yes stop_codon:yes gene_type:complete